MEDTCPNIGQPVLEVLRSNHPEALPPTATGNGDGGSHGRDGGNSRETTVGVSRDRGGCIQSA